MVGKNINYYSLKRADQPVTLAIRTNVEIKDQQVQMEPKLLFQRLVTAEDHADGRLNYIAILLPCLSLHISLFRPTSLS